MKRSIRLTLRFLALIALSGSVFANEATIADIKKPGVQALSSHGAVTVRGIVTTFSGWKNSFFLQDETGGISVDRTETTPLSAGDAVSVEGTVTPGLFAPVLLSNKVTVLRQSKAPPPAKPSFDDLSDGSFDARWIEVRGVIHSARIESVWDRQILMLDLYVPGGSISVHVLDPSDIRIESLVDSLVTLRGVCGTKFNGRRQLVGLRLFVPGTSELKIETPAPDPRSIPLVAISHIQQYSIGGGSRHRVKTSGIVTYQTAAHGLYLEEGSSAIHIETSGGKELGLGDQVEALGFIQTSGYSPGMRDASVWRIKKGAEVSPVPVEPRHVIQTREGFDTALYDGRLVWTTATVVERLPNSQSQLWLLRRDKLLFQAELDNADPDLQSRFEARSTVDVVGICATELDAKGNPTSFRLLLRSSKDISIAASPYWRQSLFLLVFGFLLLVGGGLAFWRAARHRSGQGSRELQLGHARKLLIKFKGASDMVLWVTAVFTALSFVYRFSWTAPDDYLFGTASTRLAIGIACVAIRWNSSRKVWKRNCALSGALLVFALGCCDLLVYQSPAMPSSLSPVVAVATGSRVTVAVAFCLCTFGITLILLRRRGSGPVAQLFLLALGSVGYLNIAVRLYSASDSYGIARHLMMPLFDSFSFFCLSAAALFSRPGFGLMRAVASIHLGGVDSRRLIPAALILPLILGSIRLQGELAGLYDTPFGLALLVTSTMLSFGCLTWVSASALNRLDVDRSRVEGALRKRDSRLELLFEKSGIGDFTWDIARNQVTAHPIVWQLYGADGPLENAPSDWFQSRQHPDDADLIESRTQAALAKRQPLDVDFRINLPGGGSRWISCRGNVICDQSGKPIQIHGLNMDISIRKRSEAALQKSIELAQEASQRFESGLEFSRVAIWRWIFAGDQITWSGPVEKLFGKTAPELASFDQLRALVAVDDIGPLEENIATSLKSEIEFRVQYRMFVEGKVRWLAGRGGVLRDKSGQVYGMTGVNFDITAAKLSEQRLFESESSFRQLADAMPQIVWAANADGIPDYCNEQWYTFTGSSVGESVRAFVHPDDWPNTAQLWVRARADGAPFSAEVRLRRAPDATFSWHLCRALPIRDSLNKVWRWFGTSTNIDDYKRAQSEIQSLNSDLEARASELADSELRHRLLVEDVHDYAIFLLDALGAVRSWNKGAERLTGYQADEVLGLHFSTFYSGNGASRESVHQTLLASKKLGRFSEEGWRVRNDGSRFWAAAVVTPIWTTAESFRGFSAIIRDMTKQRTAEELLIAEREEAQLASHAKSSFLAAMSHEIRTPMNSILGMADLLAETELDSTQTELVHRFQQAGSTLLAIINDLLDLSKIESGHLELEQVLFDVEETAQRAIVLISPKLQRKHVNLAFRVVPGLKTMLVGDPNRLQQILVNLLGNAAKFTEHGDIVLTVGSHPDGSPDHVQFRISDTGIGIAPDKLVSIFDDFVQAGSSTARRFGGTGLGLGIARRLVETMGGTLTVESEPGIGSAFTFDAFFGKAEQPPPAGQQSAEYESIEGKRILIVDSNPTNRLIYMEMCSAWNMLAETASSSSEAAAMLYKSLSGPAPFSVVLFDRFSVDLEALEAIAEIRGVSISTPAVLITADSHPGDATRAQLAGFRGYMVKPIRRVSLLRLISSSLRTVPLLITKKVGDETEATSGARQIQTMSKLLVADDSDDNRFLIEAYLKGSRYETSFAGDGQAAIQEFEAHPFDLILMDVQMPILDGLAATAAIRALEQKLGRPPIPVIALTANAMAEDVERTKAAGCNAHLSKPISKTDLLFALDKWHSVGLSSSD